MIRKVTTIIVLLIGLNVLPVVALDPGDEEVDYSQYTPSQLHRKLGEMKAQGLQRQRDNAAVATEIAAARGQTDFDVIFYKVEMEVDIPAEQIYGIVTITARSLIDGLDSAQFDFSQMMTVDSVFTVDSTLGYGHLLVVMIGLDKVYNTGEEFTLSIAYHGHPAGSGLDGFSFDTRNGFPVVSSLSEPWAARSWWPCKDRPDDKADSMDISITCDTAYYCASNGTLIDTVNNGDGTWTFDYEVRYPIATYLFSIAISNYTVWTDWYYYGAGDSMEVIHHVYPDRYPLSLSSYNITPYAIGVLADIFGEYPFVNEKYGHANFQWGGAMEHQTVSSMGAETFGFTEPVIVHELGHQWWGDMITCSNWHEIWINEGFASYCEALYYEVKDGTSAYRSYMSGMFYPYGGAIYIYDTTNVNNIFSLIVYDKGAWVLHMLRHVIGDTDFFNSLRAFYSSASQYADAGTEDFKNICETVSGEDLDYFFDQWIYGQYFPTYYWKYMSELDPSDGKYWTYMHMQQTQSSNPQVFTMPIDLVFTYASGVDTVVLLNDVRENMYFFKSDEPPTNIQFDPALWIMKYSYKLGWTYNLIPFPLDSGVQYDAYQDSVIVRGGSGTNKYFVTSGALPVGLALDSMTGVISGTPTEFGDFTFEVYAKDQLSTYNDTYEYTLFVEETTGTAGDVNDDDLVNIFDATYLISFLYKDGPAPTIPIQADVNNDCLINIFDITDLIKFLYNDGPPPILGCATL